MKVMAKVFCYLCFESRIKFSFMLDKIKLLVFGKAQFFIINYNTLKTLFMLCAYLLFIYCSYTKTVFQYRCDNTSRD